MTGGPAVGARAPGAMETIATASVPRGRRTWTSIVWWLVFIAGVVYFFVPLLSTLLFSFQAQPVTAAYTNTLNDPQFFATLLYSFTIGVLTIVFSIGLIVPTAVWVRLRLPQLRRLVEFVTLLPFVIPPVILGFGVIRSFGSGLLPLTNSDLGSDFLLVASYTVLSFPYMYRAVDTGLRSIDVRSLTEASQSLGAGWFRTLWQVILPNIRVSLLAGAFLTLAIVIGEYTIASILARHAFGPYLVQIGGNKAYEPAAVTLISFALTWIAMGVISVVGRGSRTRVSVAGAR